MARIVNGDRLEDNILHSVLPDEDSFGTAVFLDVETTGLSPASDEVVELALCLFEFSWETGEITQIVERYVGLREPGVPISSQAARVHGLNLAAVRGKRLDDARVNAMLMRAEFLIAHNAPFDRGFVSRLYEICNRKPWACSMSGIDWRGKGFASRGLQNLLRDHGITVNRSHRAEDDVLATLQLLSCKGQDGKSYFYELARRVGRR
ncbi:MAG: hypothetical protein KGZ63_00625 [Clostridiales bacterium]|jgi:DNA polymerase-3 subunit epsilon|nr:hypothetical protein [Clostridiales bacterium]